VEAIGEYETVQTWLASAQLASRTEGRAPQRVLRAPRAQPRRDDRGLPQARPGRPVQAGGERRGVATSSRSKSSRGEWTDGGAATSFARSSSTTAFRSSRRSSSSGACPGPRSSTSSWSAAGSTGSGLLRFGSRDVTWGELRTRCGALPTGSERWASTRHRVADASELPGVLFAYFGSSCRRGGNRAGELCAARRGVGAHPARLGGRVAIVVDESLRQLVRGHFSCRSRAAMLGRRVVTGTCDLYADLPAR